MSPGSDHLGFRAFAQHRQAACKPQSQEGKPHTEKWCWLSHLLAQSSIGSWVFVGMCYVSCVTPGTSRGQAILKTLGFILMPMGNHWRISDWGVHFLGLYFSISSDHSVSNERWERAVISLHTWKAHGQSWKTFKGGAGGRGGSPFTQVTPTFLMSFPETAILSCPPPCPHIAHSIC